jgi:hypothetical protein
MCVRLLLNLRPAFSTFYSLLEKQDYPKNFYFNEVYEENHLRLAIAFSCRTKREGVSSTSPKSNNFVKVFRRQALHISILLGNLFPQATGNSKSNGGFLGLARRLEQFALEESGASNLVLVYTRINRPDV